MFLRPGFVRSSSEVFFIESESEKIMLKNLDLHAGSYGSAPSVVSLPL